MSWFLMPLRLLAPIGPLLLILAVPGHAQEVSARQIDELARDVAATESVRAVKDLQRAYAQYAQFGLWQEMAALFSNDARIVWGETTVDGKTAIADWLRNRVGGRQGLAPGAMHAELIDSELINLSPDGRSAKMRLEGMAFRGDGKGNTFIDGGTYENEYVLEDGKWKFSLVRYFPQFEGDYARGWANVGGGELPWDPYHFTVDESGQPILPPTEPAPASDATLADLETRIDKLNQEDAVRNLQNAFGYYVDRKMWDDVVDLFAEDSAVEIAGVGTFRGKVGVRRAMELMGEQGLTYGELNDHPLFSVMVEVLPGHQEALTRGIDLGLVANASEGTSHWEFNVFRNRFAKEHGLWMIKELRIYPLLKADYAEGWGHGGVERPTDGMLPAFIRPNPVTGAPVMLTGVPLVGNDRLTDAPVQAQEKVHPVLLSDAERLFEAKRRLRRSAAYDGVENVSHAYGYYLTDAYWNEMSLIFAKNGNKMSPFAGYYLGQARIQAAATAMYGPRTATTRPGIPYHWRPQPVILVSHDGRSANLRTRLFQPSTSMPRADSDAVGGGISGGMYLDQAVLENGIWRLWTLTIDEHYYSMAGWKGGWAAAKTPEPGRPRPGPSVLVERLSPDILLTDMGRRTEHFRGGTGETYQWPQILPMWFNYKNPVSGRVPEYYWPDSATSLALPQSRLIANGYQMPPAGPELDGLMIELTPPDAADMDGD
jgi:hypothetical protein